eukprot:8365583-Alexandrium_andersonii.AAC.1
MPPHGHRASQAPRSGSAVGAGTRSLRRVRPDEMARREEPGGHPHEGGERRPDRPPLAVCEPAL